MICKICGYAEWTSVKLERHMWYWHGKVNCEGAQFSVKLPGTQAQEGEDSILQEDEPFEQAKVEDEVEMDMEVDVEDQNEEHEFIAASDMKQEKVDYEQEEQMFSEDTFEQIQVKQESYNEEISWVSGQFFPRRFGFPHHVRQRGRRSGGAKVGS